MSIAISEEKFNAEAAALELARQDITFELEKKLDLRQKIWNMGRLFKRIEEYMLKDSYLRLRRRVVESMSKPKQIPDYKVEQYLRNFILEPLVDNNYQRLLQKLKLLISDQLIDVFPYETLHLENPDTERLAKTIDQFLPYLDISRNFPTINILVSAEANWQELKAKQQRLEAQPAITENSRLKVLEHNCGFLLDLCCKVLEAVITNYDCGIVKTDSELDKLRVDFRNYCRERITHCKTVVHGISPESFSQVIKEESEAAWKIVKKKIDEVLSLTSYYDILLNYRSRLSFRKFFSKTFRDELNHRLFSRVKLELRPDLFLYHSIEETDTLIRKIIDFSFGQMVTGPKVSAACYKLVFRLRSWLTQLIENPTNVVYGYFPKDYPNWEQVLTLENRKAIFQLAFVSTPKTVLAEDYEKHKSILKDLAISLDVHLDPSIHSLLTQYPTLDSRWLDWQKMIDIRRRIERFFEDQYSLNNEGVSYIVFGLFFLIRGKKDLEVLKEGGGLFKSVNYARRRLIFQTVRGIKNGGYCLLNYQIILILETLLEEFRLKQNEQNMQFEMNSCVKKFRETPLENIVDMFIKKSNEREGEKKFKDEDDDKFAKAFLSEIKFQSNNPLQGDDVHLLKVNKELTVGSIVKSPIRRPKRMTEMSSQPDQKFTLSDVITIRPLREKENREEEKVQMLSKFKYLFENTKKFEFVDLHPGKNYRSRCPVICLNGFKSEDSDKVRDWEEVAGLFPFTECWSINWESFTLGKIIMNYYLAARHLSVNSVADHIIGRVSEVVAEREGRVVNPSPNTNSPSKGTTTALLAQSSSQENPFEKQQQEPEPSIISIIAKADIRNLLDKETLLAALVRLFKPTNSAPMKPKSSKISVPATTLSTGVYDFYQINPFTMAYHNAVLAGQLLGILIGRGMIFPQACPSLLGFSLGSVFAYSACLMMFDLGCKNRVGDLLLMGSCVDLMSFGQNVHKLIGSRGVVSGKLTVLFTTQDSILSFLFKTARLGEIPIGLHRVSDEFVAASLRDNDPIIKQFSPEQLQQYMRIKYENVDVSERVFGHTDYAGKMVDLLSGLDFNSDLQYFKERS